MSDTNISNFVDKATSEYLISTDWGVNMQICDYVNNDPGKSKETIAKVTKKLKDKSYRVQGLALDLLETLVKNCEPVHAFVGGKECQAEIIKLVQNKKTKDNVRERALELVQYWSDNFSRRPEFPLYNQTYLLLRKTGVSFPPRRKDEIPLVFRKDTAPPPQRSQPQSGMTRERSHSNARVGGGLPSEFQGLRESISLASEMLTFTNVEEDDPNSNEILKDLVQTCKDAMPTIRAALESGNFSSEDAMVEMLSLNDELLKIQEQFEELLVSREHFLKYGPSRERLPQSQTQTHSQYTTTTSQSNSSDLIGGLAGDLEKMKVQAMQPGPLSDLDLFLGGPVTTAPTVAVTAPSAPPTIPAYNPFSNPSPQTAKPAIAPAPSGNAFDEFDMLANRHNSTSPIPTTTTTTSQPILTPLPTSAQNVPHSTGFGQPVLTPLKPSSPLPAIAPQYNTNQYNTNNLLSTSPNPSQGLMGTSPVRQTVSPTPAFPNYTTMAAQPYPSYGAPMPGYPPVQPQPMGTSPYGVGVPYGTYTQQMPAYYQAGTYPNYAQQPPQQQHKQM